MRALDEHVKLARASIDFYPELDAAFEINVAKVRAVIPPELRARLQGPVEGMVRAAQAAYRAHSTAGRDLPVGRNQVQPRRSRDERVSTARPALESAARKVNEVASLRRIVRQLRQSEPALADQLGW